MSGFGINENKGFKITFVNGVTVSIQFGYGNYCDNRMDEKLTGTDGAQSDDAEVAIWDEHKWITGEYDPELSDTVKGHVTPSEIPKIMLWAEAYQGVKP